MSSYQPRHGPAVSLRERPDAVDEAAPEAEGCLAVAVRWPVRVVVLVLVVPVRMVWDALVACGRLLRRVLWQPFVRGLGRLWHTCVAVPAGAVWRWVLAPVGRGIGTAVAWLVRYLFVVPAQFVYRCLLTPLGHALAAVARGTGAGLGWLVGTFVVLPARWTYAHVLTPFGHGLLAAARGVGAAVAWLVRYLVVVPAVALWAGFVWLLRMLCVVPAQFVYRCLLTPLGRALAVIAREVGHAFQLAWSVAGRVSRAVFGFLGRVLRWLFVAPFVQVWRHVVRPAGRGVRDHVWRPAAGAVREAGRAVRGALGAARASVRQTRAGLRGALLGTPREKERDPLSR